MKTKQHEPPPDPTRIEPLVGADVIAPLLDCKPSTVIDWHHTQGLPGVRIGKRIKFLVSKVVAWRDARQTVVTVRREDVTQPTVNAPPRRGRMKRAEIEAINEEFPD